MSARVYLLRAVLRAGEALIYLVAAAAAVILLRQVMFMGLALTLGNPGLRIASSLAFLVRGALPTLDRIPTYVELLVPGTFLAIVRLAKSRHRAWAICAGQGVCGLVCLAYSYRLLALAAFLALIALQVRAAQVGRSRVPTWVALAVVIALAFLPVDLSLQSVRGGPRFLPTRYGMSSVTLREAERGQYVIVGDDVRLFSEPSWLWVW